METLSILPYFHPTTVVLVDDNLDFLGNLSLQLDADLAYRLFDSPNKALEQLNNAARTRPLSERFFATIKDNRQGVPAEPVLRLDLAAIQREVRNTHRFAETAVVMVDYAMPKMNGLEFCKQIRNPHVKKVLFTGVADEYVAVRAFNEGLIDRFILKSERDVYEEVNVAIHELQNAYIRDTAYTISHVLSLRSRHCLIDPVFARFFEQLRAEHKYIEYYLSVEPDGFLLLDAEGTAARLIVLTDEDLLLHGKIARAHGAPQDLLDELEKGETVPYFSASPDGFFRPQCAQWRQCLHPAQILEGRSRYYWTLVPDAELAAGGEVASYNGYLNWLDTTGYALI